MTVALQNQDHRRVTALASGYLESLGISAGSDAARFYGSYDGPFSSQNTGFVLLSIGNPDSAESVEHCTQVIRSKLDWPARYLVISDMLAHSVLVYDVATDGVYDVDFEGGDNMLICGTLPAYFTTFKAFLEWYFQGEC